MTPQEVDAFIRFVKARLGQQRYNPQTPEEALNWSFEPKPKRIREHTQTPEAWQDFKSRCVESIAGETVRADGLTHKEWIEYLKTGWLENKNLFDDSWCQDSGGQWQYDDWDS